ncbi:MAG: universal stress protein [Bacteroidota bacterium]
MKSINKILVPIDFSEHSANALRYAVELANDLDASVSVVHVVLPEHDVVLLHPLTAIPFSKSKIELVISQIQSFVTKSLGSHKQDKDNIIDVIECLISGNIVEGILEEAEKQEADLILMGVKTQKENKKEEYGVFWRRVLQNASTNIMIVPEYVSYQSIKQVICATEFIEADPFELWQVTQFMQQISPLLTCVHVDQQWSAEKISDLMAVENFYRERVPSLKLSFTHVDHLELTEKLHHFMIQQNADLLVLFKSKPLLLEQVLKAIVRLRTDLYAKSPLLVII